MKKSFLPFILLTLMSILSSCGQDYNSNYNDRGTYADIGIAPGSNLYNSYVILQNKCFSCHSWQDYKTDQAWIDSGLFTRGSFNTSSLKNRLSNFGGNMPPAPTAALTASEIETLKTWINNL